MLDAAGRHAGAEAVVTRNRAGFARSRMRVYGPDDLVRFLDAVAAASQAAG